MGFSGGAVTHGHTALIRQAYRASTGDSTALFQALVDAADGIGIES
jgi:hypothetical protein